MKTLTLSFLVCSILTVSSAFAFGDGVEHGNGGGAHVCRDKKGKITSIQMYDIYEGETRYGMEARSRFDQIFDESYGPDLKTTDDFITYSIDFIRRNTSRPMAAKVEAAIALAKKMKVFTSRTLLTSFDASRIFVDPGCAYEQVANWDERTDQLFVNEALFNAMKPIDQTALYLHEAVFYLARRYAKQVSSDDTREFVASALHSGFDFSKVSRIVPFERTGSYRPQSSMGPLKFEEWEAYKGFLLEKIEVNPAQPDSYTLRMNLLWTKPECYGYGREKEHDQFNFPYRMKLKPSIKGTTYVQPTSAWIGSEQVIVPATQSGKVRMKQDEWEQVWASYATLYLPGGLLGKKRFQGEFEITSDYCDEVLRVNLDERDTSWQVESQNKGSDTSRVIRVDISQ